MKKLNFIMILRRVALLAFICAIFFNVQNACADSNEIKDSIASKRLSLGGGIGYVSAFHDADFRALPGVPNCCPNFTSGSGGGFELWLFGELPIEQALRFGARIGFSRHSASFAVAEKVPVIIGDRVSEITFTHYLEASMSRIGIEPYLGFRLGSFGASAGFRVGVTASPIYEQRETVSSGTFGDGRNTRNQFSGTLQQASSLFFDFSAGLNYSIPLNTRKTAFLMPEVRLNYGLTPIVKNYSWSANLVTAGLSVRFEPEFKRLKVAEEPPPVPNTPALEPQKSRPPIAPITRINASFDIAAISEENKVDNTFRVEEFVSTQMYPLLNYLFFDEMSDVIPQRYNSSTQALTDKKHNELSAYYNVLNIIGERLQWQNATRITITGCNAGAGKERGDIRLARNRATAIKNYLVEKWNIGPERIKIEARGLPEHSSNPDRPEGLAENRRVEITADDDRILAPVYVRDTVRGLPKSIQIRPTVSNAGQINNWDFVITQNGRQLAIWQAKGAPPYELNISSRLTELRNVDGDEPLLCTFTAYGADGKQIAFSESSMPVEYVTLEQKRSIRAADKEIERFRLMLFDFDQSEPGATNRRIITDISRRITPESFVNIIGATDAAGDADYNKRLSLARAQAVARILGNNRATVEGAGASGGEFDNSLPEGRFYNRNVTIEAITPQK